MQLKLISLLAAVALTASLTSAQVSAGMFEVNASGSWDHTEVEDTDIEADTFTLEIDLGYFVTDNVEIVGALAYAYTETNGFDADTTFVKGGVDYLFTPSAKFIPFIGASAVYANLDSGGADSEDEFGWEARAGMKAFVAENVAITTVLAYIDLGSTSDVSVSFGFSYFLGAK